MLLDPHLVEGRSRLIEELQGERYKLMSRDENSIDCIAVDRRGKYVPRKRAVHFQDATLKLSIEGHNTQMDIYWLFVAREMLDFTN